MQLERDSKLLRIFIGELDKSGNTPLYEALVLAAKINGISGATVLRAFSRTAQAAEFIRPSYWIFPSTFR